MPSTEALAASAVGQGYAEQRYYNSSMGAFWTPDPGGIKTANPRNPLSWNRYAYTKGNPIGRIDRHGLEDCDDDDGECDEQSEESYCDLNPEDPICNDLPGSSSGSTDGNDSSTAPPCPPVPSLPGSNAAQTVQQNITTAHNFYNAAMQADPNSAMSALFGFFTAQFEPGGAWDYKKQASGKQNKQAARVFGNFDFGAVLESFGFSYFFTQNAAGIAQIGICLAGGACGTGIPGVVYPYGDQINDAVDVQKGFNYETAVQAGCAPNK
jgi:RHS repeat-associated protein